MITVKNLSLKNRSYFVLKNISIEIEEGAIAVFIGKSGAGKTMILKCIANIIRNYTGKIFVDGVDPRSASNVENAARMGFVFQDFNLFPTMTVLENCIDPLLIRGESREQASMQARDYLSRLAVSEYQMRYPDELSVGQQQRVALARALALEPQVLILDEPTSSLDPENTQGLVEIIQELHQQGITILISSQDMPFVNMVADTIFIMERGEIIEQTENEPIFLQEE